MTSPGAPRANAMTDPESKEGLDLPVADDTPVVLVLLLRGDAVVELEPLSGLVLVECPSELSGLVLVTVWAVTLVVAVVVKIEADSLVRAPGPVEDIEDVTGARWGVVFVKAEMLLVVEDSTLLTVEVVGLPEFEELERGLAFWCG
jgi:hypothetical protein